MRVGLSAVIGLGTDFRFCLVFPVLMQVWSWNLEKRGKNENWPQPNCGSGCAAVELENKFIFWSFFSCQKEGVVLLPCKSLILALMVETNTLQGEERNYCSIFRKKLGKRRKTNNLTPPQKKKKNQTKFSSWPWGTMIWDRFLFQRERYQPFVFGWRKLFVWRKEEYVSILMHSWSSNAHGRVLSYDKGWIPFWILL